MKILNDVAKACFTVALSGLALSAPYASASEAESAVTTQDRASHPAACPSARKTRDSAGKADAKRALDAFQNARTAHCQGANKDKKAAIAIQEEGANVKKEKGVEDVE